MFGSCSTSLYFYFSRQRPARNALALAQRLMAAVLLRASPVAYVSTSAWRSYLRPWGAGTLVELPVPATVAAAASDECVSRWSSAFRGGDCDAGVVGHFGTFGDHMTAQLMAVGPAVLEASPTARFVFVGRGADGFAAAFGRRHPALGARLRTAESLASGEVPAALRACDVVVQPYPDGVTTRRTSVMAALANSCAVVTTDGALTEAVWRGGGVALAPAGDAAAIGAATARLLRDPAARSALGASGRRLYEARFDLEHTLDVLTRAGSAA